MYFSTTRTMPNDDIKKATTVRLRKIVGAEWNFSSSHLPPIRANTIGTTIQAEMRLAISKAGFHHVVFLGSFSINNGQNLGLARLTF